MTAETDLLPLPEPDGEMTIHMAGRPVEIAVFCPSTMHVYARACVSSATEAARANLAELQREVEGLRAQKDRLTLYVLDLEKDRSDLIDSCDAYRERAERLAGALRELITAYVRLLESGRDRIRDLGGECDPVDVMERSDIDLRKARAALDQETTNG